MKVKFVTIDKLSDSTHGNIYGVVMNYLPTKKSKGTDYVTTLDIIDESGFTSLKIFSEEIMKEEFIPGDIIRANGVKVFSLRKSVLGFKNDIKIVGRMYSTEEINDESDNLIYDLNFQNKRIKELKKHFFYNDFFRYKKIKDIEEHRYFDFIGYLINKKEESNNLVIYSFVDFTENSNVKFPFKIDGYSSNNILFLKAWGEREEIEINKYYIVRNIKVCEISYNITASLSENNYSLKQLDENNILVKEIKTRELEYKKSMKKEIVKEIEQLKENRDENIVHIKDIKKNTHVRIFAFVKAHFPLHGKNLYTCKKCNLVLEVKKEHEHILDEEIVCNLILKDNTSEILVTCKNQNLQKILKSSKFRRKNYFYSEILNLDINDKNYNFMIDCEIQDD